MTDLLLVASLTALILLNAVDSFLTRMALRKGHPELNRFTRSLIKKLGLDRAMLFKALLPIPFASFVTIVVFILDIPGIAVAATIASLAGVVFFSFVLLFNCRQLIRGQKAKG